MGWDGMACLRTWPSHLILFPLTFFVVDRASFVAKPGQIAVRDTFSHHTPRTRSIYHITPLIPPCIQWC